MAALVVKRNYFKSTRKVIPYSLARDALKLTKSNNATVNGGPGPFIKSDLRHSKFKWF